jgi:hypothetical protein
MHYERKRRTGTYGEPHARRVMPAAEDSPRYVGADAQYKSIHRRMVRSLGSARELECVGGCGSRAREWAYDHEDPHELVSSDGWPVSVDVSHYQPMCARCHHARDREFRRAQRAAAYREGRWCGECRYGVVEDPPCCTLPTAAAS